MFLLFIRYRVPDAIKVPIVVCTIVSAVSVGLLVSVVLLANCSVTNHYLSVSSVYLSAHISYNRSREIPLSGLFCMLLRLVSGVFSEC